MNTKLRFIDFCAGIGGGRLGLERLGFDCLAHSENDPNPATTYQLFFDDHNNLGDLTKIKAESLPDFDLLLAGFPCQAFSIVGKRQGFKDERGQIIYYLSEILKIKNIPFFILENVKGLINHHNGETLKEILKILNELNYDVVYQVLDSQNYGVPQMRERVYFVGIRKDIPHKEYCFPKPVECIGINQILNPQPEQLFNPNDTFHKYLNNKYNQGKYSLTELVKDDYLIIDWRQSDLRLYSQKIPTLRTGRHGILYSKSGKLWKLSGYEALLLQGFPEEIANKVIIHNLPNSKILSQAGNAMTVNVITKLAEQLLISI